MEKGKDTFPDLTEVFGAVWVFSLFLFDQNQRWEWAKRERCLPSQQVSKGTWNLRLPRPFGEEGAIASRKGRADVGAQEVVPQVPAFSVGSQKARSGGRRPGHRCWGTLCP